jgi:hypothetical protein
MTTVTLNAWTGEGNGARGEFGAGALAWALGGAGRELPEPLKPEAPPDWKNWHDARVGWGVILPERDGEGFSDADLRAGADAPAPIRKLIGERSDGLSWTVPILRYRKSAPVGERLRLLRNLAAGKDLSTTGSAIGTRSVELPKYLLIVGSPAEIPWQLQYVLSAQRGVGRLDLPEEGLGRYVDALLSGWRGAAADPKKAVVWSVVHDGGDITAVMNSLIARRVHQQLVSDRDLGEAGARFLDATVDPGLATHQALAQALATDHPALVVTTSHGKTGPLGADPAVRAEMTRDLGLLVDQGFKVLDPDALLAAWQPEGAIWYAHACCSAGSSSDSAFAGLFDSGDKIEQVLSAVAALGDLTAPLPRRLLGAERPLRAFIGHVEPTFDWTLKETLNEQPLTTELIRSIHPGLYLGEPPGLAFERWQSQADAFHRLASELDALVTSGNLPGEEALFPRLAWRDVESTVILGDPTAALAVG